MSSYFDVLDSDDEGPVQKVAAPAPAAAVSKKAPVGGARRTAGGKSRSSGFTKTQNEGAVTGPRRTDRNRDGARGNRGGSRGGGAPRAGKREFDRRGGRPAAGAKGSSEADAVLQSAIEAEALAPTDGETPVADATPQEPEPEDSYVSFDAYMKQVSTEKSGAAFAGEKAARDAKPEAVAGRSHKKDDALPEDDVKALLGSGIAQKSSKKAAKTKATVDSKALGFKSAPKDDRPPRRDDDSRGPRRDGPRRDGDSRGPRRDGPRRDGDSRGPRRDGPRRDGDSRGPRRDGGAARSGGAARGGAKRAAAPKAGDFPTLGGK